MINLNTAIGGDQGEVVKPFVLPTLKQETQTKADYQPAYTAFQCGRFAEFYEQQQWH